MNPCEIEDEEIFDIDDWPDKNPLNVFSKWLYEAQQDPRICQPNAVQLGTSTLDGVPSVRTVLLRKFCENGFKYFTSNSSGKAIHLDANPTACLNFYWSHLKHQVRIVGTVEKLSEEESNKHFKELKRPYQICSHATGALEAISSRMDVDDRKLEIEEQFYGREVERPKHWGVHVVKPYSYEFYKGNTDGFQDRIRFRHLKDGEEIDVKITKPAGNGWYYERLFH